MPSSTVSLASVHMHTGFFTFGLCYVVQNKERTDGHKAKIKAHEHVDTTAKCY